MQTASGVIVLVLGALLGGGLGTSATAQPLGSFTWQLQPFCNRVTVNVRQDGDVYTLDGFDDQCGAGQRAPLVGLATPNPDGTIGFGLHIVVSGGKPVNVDARIALASLGGTWTDSAGNAGTFAFGANTGGTARPAPAVGLGDITAVAPGTGLTGGGPAGDVTLSVDPAVVQSRVSTACAAGQALRSIAQNGTAVCEPIAGTAGGDITAVNPGVGLVGGGVSGDVSLAVVFGGTGAAPAAARSDHTHAVGTTTSVGVGPDVLLVNTGNFNTAVGRYALRTNSSGSGNVAVGLGALETNTTGAGNVAAGQNAMAANTTGRFNTAIGQDAGADSSTGERNTLVGRRADLGSGDLINATALGANARVDVANALVLGSINGVNGATANVNVGIGTTAPTSRLDIQNDDFGFDLSLTTAGRGPLFRGRRSNGTLANPTATGASGTLLSMFGWGHDGTSFQGGGGIQVAASQQWASLARGTRIDFYTTPNGTIGLSQAMTIDHDGQVGIGTGAPADRLHVLGDVRVGNCVRNSAGTQIAGTCASDERFKREITPFPAMLDRVAALRPVHYFWRAAEFPARAWSAEQTYGLVAQDVEAVLPDLVHTMPDGYKAVDYSKLPLLLLQAVRELKDANDTATARNRLLEQQQAELRRRLTALERALAGRDTSLR